MVRKPDRIDTNCFCPFSIIADGCRARHAQPPQTETNTNFDAAHVRVSLRKSGGTLPDSLTVILLTLWSASLNCVNTTKLPLFVVFTSAHLFSCFFLEVPRFFTAGCSFLFKESCLFTRAVHGSLQYFCRPIRKNNLPQRCSGWRAC